MNKIHYRITTTEDTSEIKTALCQRVGPYASKVSDPDEVTCKWCRKLLEELLAPLKLRGQIGSKTEVL